MERVIRKYANAIEIVVQTDETDEELSGWVDLFKERTELLELVTKMIDNQDNEIGRKNAVLNYKHSEESIRYIADKIMEGDKLEVEDRTNITI